MTFVLILGLIFFLNALCQLWETLCCPLWLVLITVMTFFLSLLTVLGMFSAVSIDVTYLFCLYLLLLLKKCVLESYPALLGDGSIFTHVDKLPSSRPSPRPSPIHVLESSGGNLAMGSGGGNGGGSSNNSRADSSSTGSGAMRTTKYECTRCGRSYLHQATLVRHQRYECGISASYPCSLCHRKFKRRDVLKGHMEKCVNKTVQQPQPSGAPSFT